MNSKKAVRADEEVAAIRVRILAKRIRELEQALRKLSLENEILWEALKTTQEEVRD